MGCSSCGKSSPKSMSYDVMGGYKYLSDRQIKARLEVFKKRNCKDCEKRYDCNYEMYMGCKKPGNT